MRREREANHRRAFQKGSMREWLGTARREGTRSGRKEERNIDALISQQFVTQQPCHLESRKLKIYWCKLAGEPNWSRPSSRLPLSQMPRALPGAGLRTGPVRAGQLRAGPLLPASLQSQDRYLALGMALRYFQRWKLKRPHILLHVSWAHHC